VSASEEFPAFPGAAEGGRIPLLAAESIALELPETTESLAAGGFSELLPQEIKPVVVTISTTKNIFFIKMIFGKEKLQSVFILK
jgi:biopolymer transport protein ExbD